VKRQLRMAMTVAAAQYFAAILGAGWGWAEVRHFAGIPPASLEAGCLAAMAITIDWLRFLATPRSRSAHPIALGILPVLACFLAWLMAADPFLFYWGDRTFVWNILLLTPLLLAMSPLVRDHAWLALAGTILFFATSIAMMVHNACCRGGFSGFFERGIY
jgi:hypothetical protein